MKTSPSAQTLGFFDVELRVQWLEAKGNPLSRLDAVIDERFLPALHWAAVPQGGSGNWFDQPDLSRHGGSPLRIPIPNRDCHPDLIGT